MKKMICEICESSNFIKESGYFTCQDCLCKYSVEEAKKLIKEIQTENCLSIENEINNYGDFDIVNDKLIRYNGNNNNVKIPEGVKTIGTRAFFNCANLVELTLPNSVLTIEESAFFGCVNLEHISIPNSIISIGYAAFLRCEKIKTTSYGNGEYLGNDKNPYLVLYKIATKNILSFDIYDGTKVLYESIFDNCTKLDNITIPCSVTWIGAFAFRQCVSLTKISLQTGVIGIDKQTFSGCYNLADVVLPEGLLYIGEEAFSYCSKLKSVTLPNSLVELGASAFNSCSLLANISIPDKILKIGDNAFYKCNSLTYNVYENGVYIGSQNNKHLILVKIQSKEQTSTIIHPETKFIDYGVFAESNIQEIELPEGLLGIASTAFRDCKNLKSIHLPESVTELGQYSFARCTNLNSINLSANLKIIKNSTFIDCSNLTNHNIPFGVTHIDFGAFSNCNNLKTIQIPSTVVSIKENAFLNCSNLVIWTKDGTYAEQFAKNKGIPHTNNIFKYYESLC